MHYVIGDVHGCYDEMTALLQKIEENDKEAIVYFVGDFVDRGPQVDKVLAWCMENITADGKYQAVRGNHEEMILEWYAEWMKWWEAGGFQHPENQPMPETGYDFSKWADGMDILEPMKLKPYMDFLAGLPYDKALELESVWGQKNTFRIVHAFYEFGEVPEEVQHHSNIWKRIEYGNHGSDEILVHGHTPTLDFEYIYWGVQDTKPGLISYRQNDINVDGGCVFAKEFPMYPAMLCAIRLEDLEEIYVYSVEECFLKNASNEEEASYQKERCTGYIQKYMSHESKCRRMLLQKMGHPDYQLVMDNRAIHVPGYPQFREDQEVVFKKDNEQLHGTIEIVNAYGIFGDNEQPYYDILADIKVSFVLYKGIPESDVTEIIK